MSADGLDRSNDYEAKRIDATARYVSSHQLLHEDTIMRVHEDTGSEILDYACTPWRIQFCREITGKLMKLPRVVLFAISPDMAVRFLRGYGLMILAK
jgi:hypothetical protein